MTDQGQKPQAQRSTISDPFAAYPDKPGRRVPCKVDPVTGQVKQFDDSWKIAAIYRIAKRRSLIPADIKDLLIDRCGFSGAMAARLSEIWESSLDFREMRQAMRSSADPGAAEQQPAPKPR